MNLDQSLALFGLTSLEGQTEDSLKKLYHSLAGKYHPDKGGSSEEFIGLRRAYIYLRTSLLDPKNQSSGGQHTRTEHQSQYSRSESHQQNQSNGSQSSPNEVDNPYIEAYNKAIEQMKQYEEIFNAQVRLINNTNKLISQQHEDYSLRRESLKKVLDDQLEVLNKHYHRAWWEYVVPIPKMNRNDYVTQHNVIIGAYNTQLKTVEDTFLEILLHTYQSGFEQIIGHLK
jgi:curved DNA-binding protein CbpA